MTSANFSSKFVETTGLSKQKAREILSSLEEAVKYMVKNGESFHIAGLSVNIVDVPAHEGRNPATGETVYVPDKKRVTAKPTPSIKEAANS